MVNRLLIGILLVQCAVIVYTQDVSDDASIRNSGHLPESDGRDRHTTSDFLTDLFKRRRDSRKNALKGKFNFRSRAGLKDEEEKDEVEEIQTTVLETAETTAAITEQQFTETTQTESLKTTQPQTARTTRRLATTTTELPTTATEESSIEVETTATAVQTDAPFEEPLTTVAVSKKTRGRSRTAGASGNTVSSRRRTRVKASSGKTRKSNSSRFRDRIRKARQRLLNRGKPIIDDEEDSDDDEDEDENEDQVGNDVDTNEVPRVSRRRQRIQHTDNTQKAEEEDRFSARADRRNHREKTEEEGKTNESKPERKFNRRQRFRLRGRGRTTAIAPEETSELPFSEETDVPRTTIDNSPEIRAPPPPPHFEFKAPPPPGHFNRVTVPDQWITKPQSTTEHAAENTETKTEEITTRTRPTTEHTTTARTTHEVTTEVETPITRRTFRTRGRAFFNRNKNRASKFSPKSRRLTTTEATTTRQSTRETPTTNFGDYDDFTTLPPHFDNFDNVDIDHDLPKPIPEDFTRKKVVPLPFKLPNLPNFGNFTPTLIGFKRTPVKKLSTELGPPPEVLTVRGGKGGKDHTNFPQSINEMLKEQEGTADTRNVPQRNHQDFPTTPSRFNRNFRPSPRLDPTTTEPATTANRIPVGFVDIPRDNVNIREQVFNEFDSTVPQHTTTDSPPTTRRSHHNSFNRGNNRNSRNNFQTQQIPRRTTPVAVQNVPRRSQENRHTQQNRRTQPPTTTHRVTQDPTTTTRRVTHAPPKQKKHIRKSTAARPSFRAGLSKQLPEGFPVPSIGGGARFLGFKRTITHVPEHLKDKVQLGVQTPEPVTTTPTPPPFTAFTGTLPEGFPTPSSLGGGRFTPLLIGVQKTITHVPEHLKNKKNRKNNGQSRPNNNRKVTNITPFSGAPDSALPPHVLQLRNQQNAILEEIRQRKAKEAAEKNRIPPSQNNVPTSRPIAPIQVQNENRQQRNQNTRKLVPIPNRTSGSVVNGVPKWKLLLAEQQEKNRRKHNKNQQQTTPAPTFTTSFQNSIFPSNPDRFRGDLPVTIAPISEVNTHIPVTENTRQLNLNQPSQNVRNQNGNRGIQNSRSQNFNQVQQNFNQAQQNSRNQNFNQAQQNSRNQNFNQGQQNSNQAQQNTRDQAQENFNQAEQNSRNENFNQAQQNTRNQNLNQGQQNFNQAQQNTRNQNFNQAQANFNRAQQNNQAEQNSRNQNFIQVEQNFNQAHQNLNRVQQNSRNQNFDQVQQNFNQAHQNLNRAQQNFNQAHQNLNRAQQNSRNQNFNQAQQNNFNQRNQNQPENFEIQPLAVSLMLDGQNLDKPVDNRPADIEDIQEENLLPEEPVTQRPQRPIQQQRVAKRIEPIREFITPQQERHLLHQADLVANLRRNAFQRPSPRPRVIQNNPSHQPNIIQALPTFQPTENIDSLSQHTQDDNNAKRHIFSLPQRFSPSPRIQNPPNLKVPNGASIIREPAQLAPNPGQKWNLRELWNREQKSNVQNFDFMVGRGLSARNKKQVSQDEIPRRLQVDTNNNDELAIFLDAEALEQDDNTDGGEFQSRSPNQLPYPNFNLNDLPDTPWSCEGKEIGKHYADTATKCQMYHVCSRSGGKNSNIYDFRFLCSSGTVFNERIGACDLWERVDCGSTESIYSLLDEISRT